MPIDSKPQDDKWFHQPVEEPYQVNRRKSTRYVRSDIGVIIRKVGLWHFSFINNSDIPVKLIDISSRGILIFSDLRLTINKKVYLVIRFSDFKEFEVPAIVVRISSGNPQVYGVKFNKVNEDLADYLLKTQRRLSFK